MKRYNFAIDVAFEFITEDEDPIIPENLEALVEAARERLNRILEAKDHESFSVYDMFEE